VDAPYRTKARINLRTTGAEHVTLYRTWRPSDLFTGPHGQVARMGQCCRKNLLSLAQRYYVWARLIISGLEILSLAQT